MIKVSCLRHLFPERAGFKIDRKNGYPEYTLLHFINPMDIMVDGKIIRSEPHAFIIYRPNTPQLFFYDKDVVHDWIHFYNIEEEYFDKIGLKLDTLYYPKNPKFITDITREMESSFFGEEQNKDEFLDIKLRELFIKVVKDVNSENTPTLCKNHLIEMQDLRKNMFLHIDQEWNVKKMANMVSVSESRFYSIYKKVFGISPLNDLIQAKIDNAKNKLLYEDCSIEQIAYSLCYNNVTHFIRQFKKSTGVSPNAYRKSNRK